ncbi:MAG: Zn-dependent protease [Bacteroidia bacterium]|nr:Zn-dependent protease [Bacteroidia bacterium]
MKQFFVNACIILLFISCINHTEPAGLVLNKTFTNKKETPVSGNHKIVISLAPLGEVDSDLLKLLQKETEQFYNASCFIMKKNDLPKSAFYKPRNRYKADSLLVFLSKIKPDSVNYIAGLTTKDISTTSGKYDDWGVFGLGQMPGACCVISTFRLKPTAKSQAHFEERMVKVVLHELGHNFGLDHCKTPGCMMEDAGGTVKTVDNEKKEMCKECREKLVRLQLK